MLGISHACTLSKQKSEKNDRCMSTMYTNQMYFYNEEIENKGMCHHRHPSNIRKFSLQWNMLIVS
jgi:hypothetical protein